MTARSICFQCLAEQSAENESCDRCGGELHGPRKSAQTFAWERCECGYLVAPLGRRGPSVNYCGGCGARLPPEPPRWPQ